MRRLVGRIRVHGWRSFRGMASITKYGAWLMTCTIYRLWPKSSEDMPEYKSFGSKLKLRSIFCANKANHNRSKPTPKTTNPLAILIVYDPLISRTPYFPIVKNNLSPTSPKPGLIIPLSLTSSSNPAIQISTPSSHSPAALTTPGKAPNTATTITLLTPHSLSVWIAAAHVPPVAMTGSKSIASSDAELLGVLEGDEAAGRW
jgi:hypothetical protein